jgi:hypothetical protein
MEAVQSGCNVCYRCREYITLSEDERGRRRLALFSRLHRAHPHGYRPNINLSKYSCADASIDRLIR